MITRKALFKDAPHIYELIEFYAKKGEMLRRPLSDVYANLRDFFVCEAQGRILGASALHICWDEMAEVRSLAVREDFLRKGVGGMLLTACLEEAKSLGAKRVFALTYSPAFFEKFSFKVVDKQGLPQKIWGDCIKCVKFPSCDETAVMAEL